MLKCFKNLKRKAVVACVMALPVLGFAQLGVSEYIYMRPADINKQVGTAWSYIPFNDFSNYFFENFFISLADEGHSTDDGESLLINDLYNNKLSQSGVHPFNWDERSQGRWDGNYWVRYQEMIILINSLINDLKTSGSELATAVNSDNSPAIIDELRVLRAFYYLQATRLYGDFPIWESYNIDYIKEEQTFISDGYPLNNVKPVFHSDLRRNPAAEVFKYIVSECQSAIANGRLPWHQTSDKNRMTLAIACAIMSQASLYAASPLYNGGENLWPWAYQVNQAAFNSLTDNGYELYNKLADSKAYLNAYHEYFALDSHDGNISTDKETIWGSPYKYHANGLYVVNGMPLIPGMFKVGACPTQDLVDAYDMKATGRPIYDLNNPYTNESKLTPNIDLTSGYDPQNPYVGRDDRFYANTFYNGSKFTPVSLHKTVATWNNSDENHWGTSGGKKGVDAIDAKSRIQTRTGYYNRKFHQYKENSSTQYPGGNWKLFRLGEVYLNFAEAAIEAGNIGKGLELINAIRHRAGFSPAVDVTANTQDYARLLVRHERQVELAFEGQRYYDVRRWKTPGSDITEEKIKTGMWITSPDNGKTFEYHRFVIDPYSTGTTSEFYVAQNQLAPLPAQTIIELSSASGLDRSYWQNPGHGLPAEPKYQILSEEEKTCMIIGFNNIATAGTSLVIPSTVELAGNTYTITGIGAYAFSGSKQLTNIELPPTITFIELGAFEDCQQLSSIEIPASVAVLDISTFWGCSNLTQINIADGNQNYFSIDGVVFSKDQTSLLIFPSGKGGYYSVPDFITTIGLRAFYCCYNLTSVSMPSSVTSIRDEAFNSCKNLTSVVIPNSVSTIGYAAFFPCI